MQTVLTFPVSPLEEKRRDARYFSLFHAFLNGFPDMLPKSKDGSYTAQQGATLPSQFIVACVQSQEQFTLLWKLFCA